MQSKDKSDRQYWPVMCQSPDIKRRTHPALTQEQPDCQCCPECCRSVDFQTSPTHCSGSTAAVANHSNVPIATHSPRRTHPPLTEEQPDRRCCPECCHSVDFQTRTSNCSGHTAAVVKRSNVPITTHSPRRTHPALTTEQPDRQCCPECCRSVDFQTSPTHCSAAQ
jgi:hypothetical protein